MAGFTSMVPNFIFDDIMPRLSPTAWLVFCFVFRKTIGFNKDWDEIATSQLLTGTGIKSRFTLTNAIKECEQKDVIQVRRKMGRAVAHSFSLSESVQKLYTKEMEVYNFCTLNNESVQEMDTKTAKSVQKLTPQKKQTTLNTTTTGADKKFIERLLKVCNLEAVYLTDPGISELNQTALWLRQAGADISDLDYFEDSYWWGKTPATLGQVKKYWAQCQAQKRGKTNGSHTNGNSKNSKPAKRSTLDDQPSFDPNTGEYVYPDGTRSMSYLQDAA